MKGVTCVLVANRGEIVVRVCRTLRRRGIRAVAVHTPADRGAVHLSYADAAVPVGDYLDAAALVAAAVSAGADAVHPGYGFLSEDPAFARAVLDAGLVWIGPPPAAIEQMGDKARAKGVAREAGVPVLAGSDESEVTDEQLMAAARRIGFPVLLKPVAGGGGKGMHRVTDPEALPEAIAVARREAGRAFADDRLLVERWVPRPRHVEVQVLADAHGTVVDLGERDCSLQRRHQKIVEECPAPGLSEVTRRAMADGAVRLARACGYVGAGTVEFVVPADRPEEHFFLEMNTRLQVEHPVTEAVTGVDLVDWQLRVAAGERLGEVLGDDAAAASPGAAGAIGRRRGHAVEARLYAEDPSRDFLPAAGTVLLADLPEGRAGVRVDAALATGSEVGTRYDPLLAKVVAWGEDRAEALDRLRAALRATAVLGVTTNAGYLVGLLGHPDVAGGRCDTGLVARTLDELAPGEVPEEAWVAAACRLTADLLPTGPMVDPWEVPDGWRMAGPAPVTWRLAHDTGVVTTSVLGPLGAATVALGDGPGEPVTVRTDGDRLELTRHGVTTRWRSAVRGDDVWVGRDGQAWRLRVDGGERAEGRRRAGAAGGARSPMPGVVVAAHVAVGDRVAAGQPLVSVEAMKMEHVVVAPVDGVVTGVRVRPGQAVALDEVVADVGTGA